MSKSRAESTTTGGGNEIAIELHDKDPPIGRTIEERAATDAEKSCITLPSIGNPVSIGSGHALARAFAGPLSVTAS